MPCIILLGVIGWNMVTFCLTGLDKWKARRHKWRTRERTFVFFSVLGGGIGTLCAFYVFRHKTQHKKLLSTIWFVTLAEIIGSFFYYLLSL